MVRNKLVWWKKDAEPPPIENEVSASPQPETENGKRKNRKKKVKEDLINGSGKRLKCLKVFFFFFFFFFPPTLCLRCFQIPTRRTQWEIG